MDNLSGPELIKALRIENPEMSIEDVLDKAREILYEQKLKTIGTHKNIFNFLVALIDSDMTPDEIDKALGTHPSGKIVQIDDAIEFINSLEEVPPPCCFPWRTAGKGRTQGIRRQRPVSSP
jgi:hypothetical protein